MRTTTLIAIALVLPACHKPEEGIDDTRIRGTVRIDPMEVVEADDEANEDLAGAQELPTINFGHTFLDGSISAWVMTEWASPDIIDGNYNVIKEAESSRRLGLRVEHDITG